MSSGDISDNPISSPLSALVGRHQDKDPVGRTVRKVMLQLLSGSRTAHYLTYQAYVADAAVDWQAVDAEFAVNLTNDTVEPPALTDRAKSRFICEAIQKQTNLEAVLSLAYRMVEETRTGHPADDLVPQPGQDWLNSFTREAEYAFSASVRERLAKLLSAELQLAGTFSRSTIRIAAELDDELLDRFFELMALRFGDAVPVESTWSWGAMFDLGLALENALLVSGVRGLTHKQVQMNDRGYGFVMSGADALMLRGAPDHILQFPVWMITPIGQQISFLREGTPREHSLRRIALLLDKTGIEAIHMGRVVEGGDQVALGEQIWPAQ